MTGRWGVALVAALAASPGEVAMGHGSPGRVVFVCEHGNVKSLIASEWFNRLAAERGLPVRGVSRGVSPESAVPAAIAERLRRDGFDVGGFTPRALEAGDLAGAWLLVMIGADPPSWVSPDAIAVARWDGIPPASERYDASRDALTDRIQALLDAIESRTRVP